MDKNFLDYAGLTKYTEKLEEFILGKTENLVPNTRSVNGKALTEDITLTEEDIGITPVDTSNLVPTSRTINGKALSTDIALSASDVGARSDTWVPTAEVINAVPASRTINGKELTDDITLTASDVGVTNLVQGIFTQEEFDALPEESKQNGTYIIPGN